MIGTGEIATPRALGRMSPITDPMGPPWRDVGPGDLTRPGWGHPAPGSGDGADHLLVEELLDPEPADLTVDAGALHAAEGQLHALDPDAFDEDHAGVDLVCDPRGLVGVVGEHVGAEPVRRVVGELDRLLLVLGPEDHGHRSEQLLAERVGVAADAGEDAGRVDRAVALALGLEVGTGVDRGPHL